MPAENECFITGNLARDPEAKYTNTGKPLCKFTVAASHKDSSGKEYTEWVPIQVWGTLAEICGNQLRKGSRVLVRGKFQTSKYKDGFGKDKYFTQIVAEQVAMVLPSSVNANAGSTGGQSNQWGAPARQQGGAQQGPEPGVMGPKDEDIPF